ncbi:P-loop containing nucleoside triphosphate hydrolase protein [Dioscorea alata]|uniref:P-loop containing nucleoside triphosphate hydrolase protein n=1 Tax=Dioscorea alata TaxID=55571 RepID=A0ACB7U7C2_DIOAL|nr:P-loop containing nucleoside triphosphate hydrolase protein [Dioscorea alata]
MASTYLSSITGAFLSPFHQVALDKLFSCLVDYLSQDSPSSSEDPNKLQQLVQNDLKAFRNSREKIKGTLRVARKLQKQDESVAHFLRELRDVVYAAQDLEDDLEYIELHKKFNKQQPESSTQSSAKRPRIASSQQLELSLDDILNNVRNITEQLNCIDSGLKDAIKMAMLFKELDKHEENSLGGQHHILQKRHVTTSSMNARKIYGREYEKAQLIRMVKEPPSVNSNVSVLPILGLGGIGKTTLAQYLFNHQEVESNFHEKAWIFVSHNFDRLRITREIIDSLSDHKGCKFPYSTNLDCLETELKKKLTGKRFLLVLDDVWSNEWTELLFPFDSAAAECVKIVVTARDQIVLQGKGKRNEIILKGLEEKDYWSFFVSCAFGDEDPAKYSPRLHDVGKQIARRLKGSPLAAKTVGQVLWRKLNVEHWMYVLKSNLWELGTDGNNIMPALALSYYHLPEHLQLCFCFCSMFPKGYEFNANSIVCMWISHGYVFEAELSSKTAEDIGHEYVIELLCRSFFEYGSSKECLKIHDLLHDLAHSVSLGECYTYEGQTPKRIPESARHLCVQSSVNLSSICEMKNLRTLVIFRGELQAHELEALKNIRVLVLLDSEVKEISPSIGHLKHLRYLDLYETSIESLPESLCELYQLKVLKLKKLGTLPSQLSNLINLQFFVINCQKGLAFSRPWELVFPLKKETGYRIAQLKGMKKLRGTLTIRKLENIQSKEDAREANLKEKCHLKELRLFWSGAFSNSHVVEEVLDSLQPHPNLTNLYIVKYMGSRTPSWLMTYSMQNLKKILLYGCANWHLLPTLGQLPFLKTVSLEDMTATIESIEDLDVVFPSLEKLELEQASISFDGMSVTRQERRYFPRLCHLSITSCDIVQGLPWTQLSALEDLKIYYSPGLDGQLPGCLQGLTSLTKLMIREAKMESLPGGVMNNLKALKILDVSLCNELTAVALQALSSLKYLKISGCSKFVYWQSEMQEAEALLPNLHDMHIEYCQSLEYLPTWLSSITSLKILSIVTCPLFRSLPESGLPSLLRELCILGCDKGLIDRCQDQGSQEWLKIKHIRDRKFSVLSL